MRISWFIFPVVISEHIRISIDVLIATVWELIWAKYKRISSIKYIKTHKKYKEGLKPKHKVQVYSKY
jgi:hypothetical protein